MGIIYSDERSAGPVVPYHKMNANKSYVTHHANKLTLVLKSGALPAPITPSNESLIGPSLGRDAIHEALKGAFYGVTAVLLFMVAYYRKSGVVADVAVRHEQIAVC